MGEAWGVGVLIRARVTRRGVILFSTLTRRLSMSAATVPTSGVEGRPSNLFKRLFAAFMLHAILQYPGRLAYLQHQTSIEWVEMELTTLIWMTDLTHGPSSACIHRLLQPKFIFLASPTAIEHEPGLTFARFSVAPS